MISLFTLEDIKQIPSGITLWGSLNPQLFSSPETFSQVNQALANLESLTYLDLNNNYSSFPVRSCQINSSIGGQSVFVALVQPSELPSHLTPDTIFYLPDIQSLPNKNVQEISA